MVAALQADGNPDMETIGGVHTPRGGEVLCSNEGHTPFSFLSPALMFILLHDLKPVFPSPFFQLTICMADCVEP